MSNKNTLCITTLSRTSPGANALLQAADGLGCTSKLALITSDTILEDIELANKVIYRLGPKSYTLYIELAKNLKGQKLKQLQSVLTGFDKIKTYEILISHDVPTPKSSIITCLTPVETLSFPLVLKVPHGNRGIGVELIKNKEEFAKKAEELFAVSPKLLSQEYIEESQGSDKRVIVAGDKIIAAMKRTADSGDFRANLHQGGAAIAHKPTEEEKRIAVAANRSLNLDFSGVDIIDSNKGPLVLEVNPSPGFGISELVGFNVAARVIEELCNE